MGTVEELSARCDRLPSKNHGQDHVARQINDESNV